MEIQVVGKMKLVYIRLVYSYYLYYCVLIFNNNIHRTYGMMKYFTYYIVAPNHNFTSIHSELVDSKKYQRTTAQNYMRKIIHYTSLSFYFNLRLVKRISTTYSDGIHPV